MKKLLMAGAVAVLAASAPIAAHASHADYRGGCSFLTLNDTTPGGQLGGQNVWNGAVAVTVRAVDSAPNATGGQVATPEPTWAISVNCLLRINGGSLTNVLSASGTGAANNADQIQFTAASGSVVELCDDVTVDGEHLALNCGVSTETPVVPQPVQDAIDQVLQAIADATAATDPLVCTALAPLAPTIDTVAPDTLYIDTVVDCDIYLFNERAIDFVPYNDAPTRTP